MKTELFFRQRKRFVQVREAPFTGRYHQIVAALDQESRAALDRRTEYVRTAVEQFNSRLPRKGCEVLIAEVKVLLDDVCGPCFNTLRNLHLPPANIMIDPLNRDGRLKAQSIDIDPRQPIPPPFRNSAKKYKESFLNGCCTDHLVQGVIRPLLRVRNR